jgi:hypothetical protein
MGIQINGQTDNISATDGSLTVSGADIGSASASSLNISGIVTATGGVVVAAGTTAAPSISPSGDSNTGIFFPSPDTIAFAEGGVESMRIDSSGRLAIGTASPASKLHVYENSASPARIYLENTEGRYEIKADANLALHYSTQFVFNNAAGTQEYARIDSSGRLLVGTPTSDWTRPRVVIVGNPNETTTGAGVLYLQKANGTVSAGDKIGEIAFSTSSSNVGIYSEIICEGDATGGSSDFPGRLVFKTCADGASSPTERMRITSDGLFKFSNTGAYGSIDAGGHGFRQGNAGNWVLETVHAATSGNAYGIHSQFPSYSPNNTSSWFYLGSDSTTNRFIVYSNGGIANYQGNNVNLSDEREKKNIEALDSTWGCLKNWDLKKFHYNEDADTDDKRYGVIAQQVAPHCPEVITDWVKQQAKEAVLDEDGNVVTPAQEEIVRMGVKEQQMYWMAIKALQEAQVRIEALEAEVAALKAS